MFISASRHDGQSDTDVLERSLAVAEAAEADGVDDLWVTEHHFVDFGVSPSAMALAAFLLGRTRNIQVGTAVTLLPLHSPVHIAEQTALLDQISHGRFNLGVGRAQPVIDYEAIGNGAEYWQKGLPEALDLTLAAFKGTVSADSELYRIPEVLSTPRPRTLPRPPVFVAATSDGSLELAARRGLPMLMFFDKDADSKAEMVAKHAAVAQSHGHAAAGYEHGFAVFAHVTDSAEEARRIMNGRARHFVESYNAYQRLPGTPAPPAPADPEPIINGLADNLLSSNPVGDVETCVERLVHHVEVSGCTRVMCQVDAVGGYEQTMHNLKRLTGEVFPAVRKRLSLGRQ
ncbi:LLM class flavin-dependent oxidoreductase [Streptomyces noursei]|uniref:LLM class flavin-dependent oxidoreductase n=1 Tax=Streptomyces noursei TaxID=1971 RepID=UPI0016789529|nr:LLM class flavin-dependent oxidoreductase [Streptomyces noursei]MCZ1018939.1 LLM class flavin-dependent oxidoreductase [Streptomyces noursei]